MKAYQLSLDVRIVQVDIEKDGRVVNSYNNGSLAVSESIVVRADGFLEVCKILAEFHKLAEMFERKP